MPDENIFQFKPATAVSVAEDFGNSHASIVGALLALALQFAAPSGAVTRGPVNCCPESPSLSCTNGSL